MALPVFVTGGSGYLGRNLLRRLVERGVGVRALARSPGSADVVAALGAEPVRGDLLDRDALIEGCKGCRVVYHCAAFTDDWDPEGRAWTINVDGTQRVLEAARHEGVPRVVHVSTEAVLIGGPPLLDVDESRPLPERPLGVYPRTKAAAERRVREANGDVLETVIVRPRFIWGNDDTTLLPRLVGEVEAGRFAWIDGGRYPTSTCHVDNACHGLLLAADRGEPGATYFVTDGEPVQFRAFVSELLRTQGVEPPDREVPGWLARALAAAGEVAWTMLPLSGSPPLTRSAVRIIGEQVTVSDDKARGEIGYQPVISREQGLEDLRERRRISRTGSGAA